MDITEHIQKLNGYFKLFNVTDEITYVLANFPEKWEIPSSIFNGRVKTTKGKNGKGYYFCAEIKEGTDIVFEAAEYVVELNKTLEAKSKLLKEKLNELKNLFMVESLNRLKTLRFEFDDEFFSDDETSDKNEDVEDDISKIGTDYIKAEMENIKKTSENIKQENTENKENTEQPVNVNKRRNRSSRNPNDTSIMAMCKDIVND